MSAGFCYVVFNLILVTGWVVGSSHPWDFLEMAWCLVTFGLGYAATALWQLWRRSPSRGSDATLEALVETYRKIWERLPSDVRERTLSAMKCWSPADYERVVKDATPKVAAILRGENYGPSEGISSAPAEESKPKPPTTGASEKINPKGSES